MFHKPEKLQNHSNKGKGKEKKKERGDAKEEKKKKLMVSLLVIIIATLKIYLAITLSKIWLDVCIRLPQYEVKWCHKFSLSVNTFIIIIIIIIIINLLQIFF